MAAARARNEPSSASEKPRDVILAACRAIGEHLEADGFSFLKSGPRLKRNAGDLTFEIYFQSDRNNIAGRRAAVWIHAGVGSRVLSNWRSEHPHPRVRRKGPGSDAIIGGQIGNLTDNPTWMEWDFADPSTRPAELEDAVSAIRKIIYPFFDLFDDPGHAVDVLVRRHWLWPTSLVEYALAVPGPETAAAAVRPLLSINPAINDDFIEAHAALSRSWFPVHGGNLGRELAALVVATDLQLGPAL